MNGSPSHKGRPPFQYFPPTSSREFPASSPQRPRVHAERRSSGNATRNGIVALTGTARATSAQSTNRHAHSSKVSSQVVDCRYKVWVSTVSTFEENSSKTDNFKVKPVVGPPPKAIREAARHKDIRSTERYMKAREERLKTLMGKMAMRSA